MSGAPGADSRAVQPSPPRTEQPLPQPGTRLASLRGIPTVLRGWLPVYAASVAMNIIALLASVAAAALAAWAVSLGIAGSLSSSVLITIALWVALLVIVRGVASWLESWLSHDVAFRALARVRNWLFRALGRLAPGGIDRRRVGDLTTTALGDAEALEVFAAHSSIYIITAWVVSPILVAAVAVLSPWTALALVPVLLAVVAVSRGLRGRAVADGTQLRQTRAALQAEVSEDVRAVREIVGFDMLAARRARLDQLEACLTRAQLRTVRRSAIENAVAGSSPVAAIVVAAATGAAGHVEATLLPVVITLAAMTPSAILQWVGVTRHYGTTREAAARIAALVDATPPVDRTVRGRVPGAGPISADAVGASWTWPGGQTPAIDRVSVRIAPGERVAIAGASGAGKSTLASLLARFMDPETGEIRLGDVPLTSLGDEGLPDAVCLVPQDVYLFAESVRDNLALAATRPVGDRECWDALRTTLAADVVERLPLGLDTVLDAGGRDLSGGERQRIALARAVITGSRVLILDETVSQLDVESERDVSAALAQSGGRTVVVIAHRLSTLLRADRIIVMDRGRVVGDGTHADLLSSPAYRALVAPQLKALR